MNKGVAITGMGIISAIGKNVEENYQSLINFQHGISRISNLETRHADTFQVGEIKLSNEDLINQLELPADNNYSRTALLGLVAAKQAVAHAGIKDMRAYKTGLISATSVGGMDKTEDHYYEYLTSEKNRHFIDGHHAGDSAEKIAHELGIKGYVSTISTACSSAANSIMLGARMIQSGFLDRVIVGGTDCLSRFTINGFSTLMILTDGHCAPFDEDRKGLNLGEAAAFLVLESDTVVEKENKEVLARLTGYGNANDAFHQTASSENGEGATLAMQKAFKVSQLDPSAISYINAHGTATPNNDLSEGKAIQTVFGDQLPPLSSTKAFTGHTLAAAGAIEAVYSILALQHQLAFPNLNFKTPIGGHGIVPVTDVKELPVNHVLSNSFGFGGNCSTLIFSK